MVKGDTSEDKLLQQMKEQNEHVENVIKLYEKYKSEATILKKKVEILEKDKSGLTKKLKRYEKTEKGYGKAKKDYENKIDLLKAERDEALKASERNLTKAETLTEEINIERKINELLNKALGEKREELEKAEDELYECKEAITTNRRTLPKGVEKLAIEDINRNIVQLEKIKNEQTDGLFGKKGTLYERISSFYVKIEDIIKSMNDYQETLPAKNEVLNMIAKYHESMTLIEDKCRAAMHTKIKALDRGEKSLVIESFKLYSEILNTSNKPDYFIEGLYRNYITNFLGVIEPLKGRADKNTLNEGQRENLINEAKALLDPLVLCNRKYILKLKPIEFEKIAAFVEAYTPKE